MVAMLFALTAGSWLAPQVPAQTTMSRVDADPLHQFNNSVKALVRRVSPSVVQIMTTGYGPVEGNGATTSLVLARQQSIGSGVIIDPDGYIITNTHVIAGAQRIQVNIPAVDSDKSTDQLLVNRTGRNVEAHIVGSDAETDLALLKIDVKGLPALPLADYNKLRQGEVVFAFGSPEGLQDSVTMGVVSAVARQRDADSPSVFVQTDAPINSGSSGGPLVNVDGELVGINRFILTEGGGNEGIGFAIPSAVVAFAYPQLRTYGHVHRGVTGIAVQAITPGLAAGLKLPTASGVIISDVAPDSPADTAGLKVKDIITSIDGQPAETLPSLGTRLFMRRGGEKIKLSVLRGSEKLVFDVLVIELPHNLDRLVELINSDQNRVSKLGIVGLEIDPKIAPLFPELRVPSGVIVAARAADASIDAPLNSGDVIHAINDTPVQTVADLRSTLDHLSPNSSVVIQIERAGKLMFVVIKLDG